MRAETILADRDPKLGTAREARKARRTERALTEQKEERILRAWPLKWMRATLEGAPPRRPGGIGLPGVA